MWYDGDNEAENIRLEKEFKQIDEGLRWGLLGIDLVAKNLGYTKGIGLTCLFRPPPENRRVGGDDDSRHQYWMAGDLDYDMFRAKPGDVIHLINSTKYCPIVKPFEINLSFHTAGTAPHLHAQVNKIYNVKIQEVLHPELIHIKQLLRRLIDVELKQ